MSEIENDYTMSVCNKKIHTFYQKHTLIDFEQSNLLLIEFLDNMFNNITSDLDANINSQLLTYMASNKDEISRLKDTITRMNIDITTSNNNDNSRLKDSIQTLNETMSKMNADITTSNNNDNSRLKDSIQTMNETIYKMNSDVMTSTNTDISHLRESIQTMNDAISKMNVDILTSNSKETSLVKDSIRSMNETMSKMNTDMMNSVVGQFTTMKKEYMEEVNQIVTNGNFTASEKMNALMEKNSEHILDKTTILLNDVIPKNQDRFHGTIQSTLKDLHTQMNEDMSKMVASSSNEHALQSFLTNFETKYNTMMQSVQQPLFSFFTASEDRIAKNIDILKETSQTTLSAQKPILDDLSQFLGKYNMSSNKGKYGEQNLCSILTSMYPSAEIQDTTGMKASGDFIMKRLDKKPILFENKEYKANIDKDEIAKFIRDIDTQNMNGIFLSQYSGIAFKQNYQIDIHKGNVLVYVQNCEYSSDRIRIAADIIDSLSVKIQELNIGETNNISKAILDDINEEYQAFIAQKETLLMCIKDFQKKMQSQIDAMKLPAMDKYLDTKYAYVKSRDFACNICNGFIGSNRQSLSAHQRGCRKKYQPIVENTQINEVQEQENA
jgi:hypothetical protein